MLVQCGTMIRFLALFCHTLILVTLVLAVGVAPRAAAAPAVDLVGTWEGTSKGEVGGFVFFADGRVDLLKDGVSMRATMPPGGDIRYLVDKKKKPMELDIIVLIGGAERARMKMIFEALSPSSLRVRGDTTGARPAGFDGATEDDTVVLTKK